METITPLYSSLHTVSQGLRYVSVYAACYVSCNVSQGLRYVSACDFLENGDVATGLRVGVL